MALLQERLVRPPAEEAEAKAEPLPTAHLECIRLTQEEIGYAPIAVAGALAEAAPSDVQAAPSSSRRGAFSTFKVPASDGEQTWMVSRSALLGFAG